MQVLNGRENEVVEMLREFNMGKYEARMYFTLLTIGESKVGTATKKASVPQSKAYSVLEGLGAKGFVELVRERPKAYRAKALGKVANLAIRAKQREIRELERYQSRLDKILRNVATLHQKYSGFRLFSPDYRR